MRRREVIALTGGVVAWPLPAWAQQPTRLPRIGWLGTGSPTSANRLLAAFREGLKALNYIEGENISIENRWAEGKIERLPELAQDLVHQRVDVILAGGSLAAEAAKRATQLFPLWRQALGTSSILG